MNKPECNEAAERASGSLKRLVRRGEVSVTMFDGVARITPGLPIQVARYCCDSPVGNSGIVHGWRHDHRGIRIVVDYGHNAGGQRLLKQYPSNVLRLAPKWECIVCGHIQDEPSGGLHLKDGSFCTGCRAHYFDRTKGFRVVAPNAKAEQPPDDGTTK